MSWNGWRRSVSAGAFALMMSGVAGLAGAQNILVDTVEDVTDFGGAQQVNDLPGPDGKVSFREAVEAANNTPGPQRVAFAIPMSEWWLHSDKATLKLEIGAVSLTDDETTLDFATQTLFTGDTNPIGNEVAIYGLEPNGWGTAAIFVFGDRCVIKGLDSVQQRGHAVELVGHDNRVIGCTLSGAWHSDIIVSGWSEPATGNIIGGTGPGEGNTATSIDLTGPCDGNIVIGNRVTGDGIKVEGVIRYGIIASNNRIGGSEPGEGNVIVSVGRYGEEGFPIGENIELVDATDTIVEGNFIGVEADGRTVVSQRGPTGIEVRGSVGSVIRNNVIGGIRVVGVNHYSGQLFGRGIEVWSTTEDTTIENNSIGIDPSGQFPIPNLLGIEVKPWTYREIPVGTVIGGDGSRGNRIAFNEREGVRVYDGVIDAVIRGNEIFFNGALGIDLLAWGGATGVTPNDVGDGDTGANDLQNFPVIQKATRLEGSTKVRATLDSLPNETFVVELFASTTVDSSGFGEAQRFLGAVTVQTDASGHADLQVQLQAATQVGEWISSTATLVGGGTSELSASVRVVPMTPGANGPPVLTR
ncbi:MAG: right-handed parallel beta-helix repeat-containing protein [Planctomycetota bacterium]